MKLTKITLMCLLSLFSGCVKKSRSIFQSDLFSIQSDRVIQGDFEARVISSTHIQSNYQSPVHLSYSPAVEFKFSLNKKDNELPFGSNHCLVVKEVDGTWVAPVITFGELYKDQHHPEGGGNLPPNTRVTFRLDMKPVLKSFEEFGYFETVHGDRIAKEDFKSVAIAGGSAPLRWDFENLGGLSHEALTDKDGDGIYESEVVLNPYDASVKKEHAWQLEGDIGHFPQFESDIPLLTAGYNLTLDEVLKLSEGDGTWRTGAKWSGVWTRDVSYAILLGLGHVDLPRCITSLRQKVKRDRIIQDTGSGGAWPVSTDRVVWALAAWEVYLVSGDEDWLREAYQVVRNSALDDQLNVVADNGLMKGETSFMDWRKQSYPRWMDNVAISQSLGLSTNMAHYRMLEILSRMALRLGVSEADRWAQLAMVLKERINGLFWQKEKGYYAQYFYGGHFQMVSKNSEALGEAFSILFDVADSAKARRVVTSTPVMAFGIPCVYPQLNGIAPYHNNGIWPFVQAFWNLAVAKVGSEPALEQGLAALYRSQMLFLTNKENWVASNGDTETALNSDYQLWSVAGALGMVYNVIMGVRLEEQGLSFKPAIPKAYGGKMSLNGFKYRNGMLDIVVRGFGNRISSFKVDGVEQAPWIDSHVTGHHVVEIVMDNQHFGSELGPNVVAHHVMLPTPDAEFANGFFKWTPVKGASAYQVFENGQPVGCCEKTSYPVTPEMPLKELSVVAIDPQGYASLASEPVVVVKPQAIVEVEVEEGAAIPFKNITGYSGTGAVKLSVTDNRDVALEVVVKTPGHYYIDVRYANGSGPWNTDNKCALRSLYANGALAGTLVMAQRGKDEWSNWGYSNSLKVALKKGKNRLNISLEPHNINMDGVVNMALVDCVRMVYAGD